MESFLRMQSAAKAKHEQKLQEKAAGSSKVVTIPWVEKYRPRSVDDVAYQDEVVSVLKKTVEGADLPNLLFCGPPGTGKTSTILAVARQLFGDMMKNRVLELNASDERGIEVVRDKVKKFSQLAASSSRADGRPCPPYKIVILDEADSMTHSAQSALRRTMEKQTKTTRFCLICNYVSRIIEPITSRCAKFRFKPLAKEILVQRLNEICQKENVIIDSESVEELVKVSEGDLRKAITHLQSAHRLKGEDGVTVQDVLDISGVIPDKVIDSVLKVCHTNSFEKLEIVVKDLRAEGHSAVQVMHQIHDRLVTDADLNDNQKSVVFEKLAVVDKCLCDGADEFLQMLDFCSLLMAQYCQQTS